MFANWALTVCTPFLSKLFIDISTYDEALASSVDDDYGISPNTAERYLYNADKRNLNSLMFFGQQDGEPLKISEDDFPENANDEYSPGYITGRITSSRKQNVDSTRETNELREQDFQELILGTMDEPMKAPGHGVISKDQINSTSLAVKPTQDTEPVRLAEALSQKLDLTDQSKDQATPLRPVAGSSSITASPSKPIDRKQLIAEYRERCKQDTEKDVINLIVLGK
ncbi:unnamed protein product [Echinostoma caproni]|uniref:Phosphoprotein n=1 Tax=Echinostoma caproni TaxID=27848 RepID=A0A183B0W0_9TREM|nr:unnamed protein product [Echinostoma caproni]